MVNHAFQSLTKPKYPNYSTSMDELLNLLETKLGHLLSLNRALREENQSLQQQLADMRAHNTQLNERVTMAAARLEVLLTQIPEGEKWHKT